MMPELRLQAAIMEARRKSDEFGAVQGKESDPSLTGDPVATCWTLHGISLALITLRKQVFDPRTLAAIEGLIGRVVERGAGNLMPDVKGAGADREALGREEATPSKGKRWIR